MIRRLLALGLLALALLIAAPAQAAIAIRGNGAVGSAINANNVTVDLSADSVVAGDVWYCVLSQASTADNALTENGATWTEIATEQYSNDAEDTNQTVFRKVQTGTPDASVTFVDGSANTADSMAVACIALSGVDTTTPEDGVTLVNAAGTDGSAADPGAITTGTDNAWVIAACAIGRSGLITVTASANYENLIQTNADDTHDAHAMLETRLIAAASTSENPAAFGNSTGGANDTWACTTISVRAAAVAASVGTITTMGAGPQ